MKKGMIILALLGCLSMTVYAREVPDLTRRGSVTVDPGTADGTLTLYRVGEVNESDGNYGFTLTSEFAGCGVSMENVDSPEKAAKLAQYAAKQKSEGTTKTIQGSVTFDNLEPGLYLLVQQKAASGYTRIEPFLVSIPMLENGTYLYEIDATPKAGEVFKTEPTTSQPTKPPEPSLPQTGQLNWPVGVMSVLGLALTAAGWTMRKREE